VGVGRSRSDVCSCTRGAIRIRHASANRAPSVKQGGSIRCFQMEEKTYVISWNAIAAAIHFGVAIFVILEVAGGAFRVPVHPLTLPPGDPASVGGPLCRPVFPVESDGR
jgi:hypothetical protein